MTTNPNLYTCFACGWRIEGSDAAATWAAACRHQEAKHPAQLWFDWSEQGLIEYMKARRW